MAQADFHVQVCFGPPLPGVPVIIDLQVAPGTTVADAVAMAAQRGVLGSPLPLVDLKNCRTGVWGKLRPSDTVLRDNDRVEIYRALVADPKEARHRRADKKAAAARRQAG